MMNSTVLWNHVYLIFLKLFRRRRQFCDHVEGYGSVCDCDHPAPIDELSSQNSPVLNNQVSFLLFYWIYSWYRNKYYFMSDFYIFSQRLFNVYIDNQFNAHLKSKKKVWSLIKTKATLILIVLCWFGFLCV